MAILSIGKCIEINFDCKTDVDILDNVSVKNEDSERDKSNIDSYDAKRKMLDILLQRWKKKMESKDF